MTDPTLIDLQRQAARRGLTVQFVEPKYRIRLANSPAVLYATRKPEYARDWIIGFRGSRR